MPLLHQMVVEKGNTLTLRFTASYSTIRARYMALKFIWLEIGKPSFHTNLSFVPFSRSFTECDEQSPSGLEYLSKSFNSGWQSLFGNVE